MRKRLSWGNVSHVSGEFEHFTQIIPMKLVRISGLLKHFADFTETYQLFRQKCPFSYNSPCLWSYTSRWERTISIEHHPYYISSFHWSAGDLLCHPYSALLEFNIFRTIVNATPSWFDLLVVRTKVVVTFTVFKSFFIANYVLAFLWVCKYVERPFLELTDPLFELFCFSLFHAS